MQRWERAKKWGLNPPDEVSWSPISCIPPKIYGTNPTPVFLPPLSFPESWRYSRTLPVNMIYNRIHLAAVPASCCSLSYPSTRPKRSRTALTPDQIDFDDRTRRRRGGIPRKRPARVVGVDPRRSRSFHNRHIPTNSTITVYRLSCPMIVPAAAQL